MRMSLLDGGVALARHGGVSLGDTGIPDVLWSLYYAVSHRWYQDAQSQKKWRENWGEEKMRVIKSELARERDRGDERERKMGEEEGSWPWTYAASLCQASLAQATHAYAALLLLLPLQPSPTPTPWHYLVKQSWRDESGKRRGLPSLSTARVGLLCLDNTARLYTHTRTHIYRVVAFSCLANHPLNLWHFRCGPPYNTVWWTVIGERFLESLYVLVLPLWLIIGRSFFFYNNTHFSVLSSLRTVITTEVKVG